MKGFPRIASINLDPKSAQEAFETLHRIIYMQAELRQAIRRYNRKSRTGIVLSEPTGNDFHSEDALRVGPDLGQPETKGN